MVKLIELLLNVVMINKRKMLVLSTTLEPKWYTASYPVLASEYTDLRLSAGRQNLSHLISYLRETW